jgi:hypothetical protein
VVGTPVGDGGAVTDGRTVRSDEGVGVADVVGLAREVRRALADGGAVGVGETAGCTPVPLLVSELA